MCDFWETLKAEAEGKGKEEGERNGEKNTLIRLAKEGVISLEKGAHDLQMSVEEFEMLLKEN